MADTCVIGVDLGGTNVRAQAVYPDGSPAGGRVHHESHAQDGTAAILSQVTRAVRDADAECDAEVAGVGLAIPGHVDDAAGIVKWSPNLGETVNGVFHYWSDVSVKPELEHLTGKKFTMANDANAAAMGEYLFGAGAGKANCMVMLTLGTGVGGGVVMGQDSVMSGGSVGPMLLVGGNKGGGELGHTLIQFNGLDCSAGSYGSLEAYLQKDAIVARAQHRLRRGRESVMRKMVKGDLGALEPLTIFEAAEAGDEVALEVWEETGMLLGAGMGSIINVFAPDVFVIGGQISKASKWFLNRAKREAGNVAIPSLFSDCQIETAQNLDNAGILGGAALAVTAFLP